MDDIIELSSVMTDQSPGWAGKQTRSLFVSVGLAGTEVLLANAALQSATAR